VVIRLAALLVALALLAAPLDAQAQQVTKPPRIGYVTTGVPSFLEGVFRQGLRDLGYIEGRNIVIEYRYADGRVERLPKLVAELVHLNVDIIVAAGGTPAALAAKRAITTIPIVVAGVGDPVGSGLVSSLARPGGNVTGLTVLSRDTAGKRLELLRTIVPRLGRAAVL